MALKHAQPLDIIDVRPLGNQLRNAVTASLIKTPTLQLMRVVLQSGQRMREHSIAGALTVQCLEGEAIVTTPSRSCHLTAGQLVMLAGAEPHGVEALSDCSLLVTVLLQGN